MSHPNTKSLLANVASRNRKIRRLESRANAATRHVEYLERHGHKTLHSPTLRAAKRVERYANDDLRNVRGY